MAENIVAELVNQVVVSLGQAGLQLWASFIENVPGLVFATAIIIIGWIVGKIVKQIVIKLLQSTKIDQWVDEQNLTAAIGGQELSVLIGSFVKWYIIAVFLAQAVGWIKLDVLKDFLQLIVEWIPLVLGALVIVLLGLLIGRFARNAVEATQHRLKKTVAVAAELIIIYIAAVIALDTIGFNVTILVDAFRIALAAFAITIAIIIGVAFGLAFKDDAKKVIADLRKGAK